MRLRFLCKNRDVRGPSVNELGRRLGVNKRSLLSVCDQSSASEADGASGRSGVACARLDECARRGKNTEINGGQREVNWAFLILFPQPVQLWMISAFMAT